jgi:hypothetical protein
MAKFKVVHEIEVEANSPLQAAKTIQEWMDDADQKWQFYVQRENGKKIYSVDLNESNSDAVLPVTEYSPMIQK